jgi:ABC-type amino acid transport substrate-binding protein
MTRRIWKIGQVWFSMLAFLTVGMFAAQAAEFDRPSTDGSMTDAMKAACTADKSPKIKQILDRGKLSWALGLAPPFGFRQQDGNYGGIEVDNARELAHMLGVEVDIQDYDYNLLPTAIATGQADIIGAELFITEQRAKVIDYSDVYFVAGQLFFVLKDSKFNTVEDLNSPDNRFIHEIGGGQVEMAEKLTPNAPIRLVPKRGIFLVGYDFIKAGEADSTAFEGHYYPVFKKEYPDLVAIGKEGRIEDAPADPEKMLYPFDIGFGLPKGDAGWKACIDAYVADLLNSGRLQDRINYWAVSMGSATTE